MGQANDVTMIKAIALGLLTGGLGIFVAVVLFAYLRERDRNHQRRERKCRDRELAERIVAALEEDDRRTGQSRLRKQRSEPLPEVGSPERQDRRRNDNKAPAQQRHRGERSEVQQARQRHEDKVTHRQPRHTSDSEVRLPERGWNSTHIESERREQEPSGNRRPTRLHPDACRLSPSKQDANAEYISHRQRPPRREPDVRRDNHNNGAATCDKEVVRPLHDVRHMSRQQGVSRYDPLRQAQAQDLEMPAARSKVKMQSSFTARTPSGDEQVGPHESEGIESVELEHTAGDAGDSGSRNAQKTELSQAGTISSNSHASHGSADDKNEDGVASPPWHYSGNHPQDADMSSDHYSEFM